MSEERNVLSLGDLVRDIWRRKVIFLTVFAVVFGAAAAWVLMRPPTYSATQDVILVVPEVDSPGAATQQAAVLNGALSTYNSLVKHARVIDPVLEAHPEYSSAAALRAVIDVKLPSAIMIQIKVTANSAEAAEALVQDLTTSFVSNAPSALTDLPSALQVGLSALPEVSAEQDPSGRLTLLLAGLGLGLIVALAVTIVLPTSQRK